MNANEWSRGWGGICIISGAVIFVAASLWGVGVITLHDIWWPVFALTLLGIICIGLGILMVNTAQLREELRRGK